MLDELGTRQERLSIGLPVWFAAVAMGYVGVPWPVVAPLGVVALVLIAGSMASTAQSATLVQAAFAAPLLAGHVAVAMPEQPLTLPQIGEVAPIAQSRPPVPSEVADAPNSVYAACRHWGAFEAIKQDCPTCTGPDRRRERAQELATMPDMRKCERIFAHTLVQWRGRTTKDCNLMAEEHPRIESDYKSSGGLCSTRKVAEHRGTLSQ